MRAAGSALPPTASAASPGRPRRTLRPAAPSWSRWAFCGSTSSPTPAGRGRRPSASPTRSTSGKSSAAAGPCTCGPRRCGRKSWPAWRAPRTRCCWKPPSLPPCSPATPGCMCRCRCRRRGASRAKLSGCGWGNTTAPGSAHSSWERKNEPAGAFVIFLTLFCLLPFSSRVKCDKMDLYERRRAEGFSAPARRKNPGRRPHCPTRFSAKQRRVLE